MAKKTEKSKSSASVKMKAVKAAKPAKADKVKHKTASPKATLAAKHGSKEALAKTLAEAVAREDEDTDQIADRLKRASNAQLLRLHAVADRVKTKYGNRSKLIAAIGTATAKSTDKDYLAKLDSMSLPQLLELATSTTRRARV